MDTDNIQLLGACGAIKPCVGSIISLRDVVSTGMWPTCPTRPMWPTTFDIWPIVIGYVRFMYVDASNQPFLPSIANIEVFEKWLISNGYAYCC